MDLVPDLALIDLAVRAFDEAVLVDPGVGRQRVDQADVRPLRGLDRADPAVVRGVHVAHLEAGALAGQAAGAEGGEAPLVGDLAERVGLIHELGQLGRAEKLAHRRGRGLGIDQVVRHHRIDLDRTHALLDRALHAQQADPVLVLHQLANRADPAVAQMVDVVDLAPAVLELHQDPEDLQDIGLAQGADRIVGLEAEARVHLDPADRGEVVAFAIEEQARKHLFRRFQGRRLARAHHPVDVDERLLAVGVLVGREGVAHVRADNDVIDGQHGDLLDADFAEPFEQLLGQLVAGLADHLAGALVDYVGRDVAAVELLVLDEPHLEAAVAQLLGQARGHLGAGLGDDLAGLGIDQIAHQLGAAQVLGVEGRAPATVDPGVDDLLVEVVEDLLRGHALGLVRLEHLALFRQLGAPLLGLLAVEREQERRHRQLAAAVDADVDQVLGVELEVQPGAAVGNHPRREEILARGVGLAAVVVEEDARAAVHLADDDPLGSVDHEGAVGRHQRHVAHVDVLLLDVADRARAGVLVHVPDDEA